MLLQIDSREPSIIKDSLKNSIKESEISNLNLGDFIIRDKNNTILMIIERKSIDDLLASVKDNRYSEQSERLYNTDLENGHIYYIIEGNKYNYSGIDEKTLYSCIFSLSYKKGFSVLFSNNIEDTLKLINEFYIRLELNKTTNKEINLIKKGKVSKENISSIMLSNIPGIGVNTAKEILTYFKKDNKVNDIFTLINELNKNDNCLDDIKIKNKKLNKNIIKNIKEYLKNT